MFLDELVIPHCCRNGLSGIFFPVLPRHGTAAVTIHFLTLGWTAPLKSALEPDKGLDNLIKVESKPVYDKISHWALFVLLFYNCFKSGGEKGGCNSNTRALLLFAWLLLSKCFHYWQQMHMQCEIQQVCGFLLIPAQNRRQQNWIELVQLPVELRWASVRTASCAVMQYQVASTDKWNKGEAIM